MAAVIKPSSSLLSLRPLLRSLSSSAAAATSAVELASVSTTVSDLAAAAVSSSDELTTTSSARASAIATISPKLPTATHSSSTSAIANRSPNLPIASADALSPAEAKLLDRLHTLIKDHHRANPLPSPTTPPPDLTIPALSAAFSALSPTPLPVTLARLLILRCGAPRHGVPFPQTLAFFNWLITTSPPTPSTPFTELIDLAGKLHHFPICHHLLDTMRSLGLPVPFPALSSLIRRLVRAGLPSAAADAFHRMPDYDLRPTPATLSSLIAVLSKKRLAAEAQSLFDALRDRFPPDVVTYTALVHAWCRAGKIAEAERIFCEMQDNSIPPNVYTYTVVIEAMCRAGQIPRAQELFSQMLDHNCIPSAATFNSFLRAHVKAERTEQALQVFNQMRQLACQPDLITYNFIIEAHCCKGQRNLDAALKVLNQMNAKGCTPDAHSFNHIFRCILDLEDVAAAHRMYTKMGEIGCKPNTVTYNLLMQLFSKEKSMDMLLMMQREMEKAGVESNVNTYKVLIAAFCERGNWKRAYYLMREMLEEKCLKPTVPVYEKLFLLLRKAGQLNKHNELMEKMAERGFIERPV